MEFCFDFREELEWKKIGEAFGCGRDEAVQWFLKGAPITLIPSGKERIPYANHKCLEHWLTAQFEIPRIRRESVIKALCAARAEERKAPPIVDLDE